jgi:hypothetical protein
VGNRGEYSSVNLSVMIEHWNGVAWSLLPVTDTGTLRSVDVIASDDIWAVGYSYGSPAQTLTMHWDGTAWSAVASPNMAGVDNNLYSVSAT